MESNANLGEEDFEILPTQTCLGCISHLFKGITACHARFSIYTSEREVIVLWFEVSALLLDKLSREPSDDGYKPPVNNAGETLNDKGAYHP